MVESSKKRRKRGSLPNEPIAILELSKYFKEKIKEKVAHLIAVGLWECVTKLKSNGHGLLTY